MGMVLYLRSVDENEVKALASDPEAYEEFIVDQDEGIDEIDFDKGWQGAAMSEDQLKVVANRWSSHKPLQ